MRLRCALFLISFTLVAGCRGEESTVVVELDGDSSSPLVLSLEVPQTARIETPETTLALAIPEAAEVSLEIPRRNGTAEEAPLFRPQPTLRLDLPMREGNYRVRVSSDRETGLIVARAETRRLLAISGATPAQPLEFIVNVRHRDLPPPPENAPGGTAVRTNDWEEGSLNWDGNLTLTFTGACLDIRRIEIEAVERPTLFLAGDSTVTDSRSGDYSSWGQNLPVFFQPEVAVANHAESGETLKSFFTALRFDKILSQAKPGDWLFLQFGHNDSKRQWPQTHSEAATTYKAYLAAYIADARRHGMNVVLVTSMHRRRFDEAGKVVDTHGGYPAAMREVAEALDLPLVDLHAMSRELYEALGPDASARAFANGGRDGTHHSAYGGFLLARCVVQSIRDQALPLAAFLKPDLGPFDPSHPGDTGRLLVDSWTDAAAEKPAGN